MWNLISIALLPVNNNFRRFFLFFFFFFGIQKSVQEMYTFLSTYKKYITRWPDIPLQSTKISTNVYLAWTKNKSLIYTDIYGCKWSVFGNKTLKCTLFSPEAQRKTGTRNIYNLVPLIFLWPVNHHFPHPEFHSLRFVLICLLCRDS